MKILITGGGGFIGSHLTEHCLAEGHEVVVLDNFSTGQWSNIAHLTSNPRLRVVKDSILHYETLEELIDECNEVYHLAAAVGVKFIIDHPLESLETNTRGTEMVLQLCDKYSKKVLLASTSEVYGKNDQLPLKEDDDRVLGPTTTSRWSYSCGKAIDEFFALAYHRTRGLPVVIVRLFNTVGPRQSGSYGMVIPRLVQQALAGKPLSVYGDGKQTRTFGYVKDVIPALVALMKKPEALGQVFNVGGRDEVSIFDLAQRIKRLTDSASEIRLIPYDEAYEHGFEDMRRRVPDCSKLHKTIGFQPETTLDKILEDVIAYYRS